MCPVAAIGRLHLTPEVFSSFYLFEYVSAPKAASLGTFGTYGVLRSASMQPKLSSKRYKIFYFLIWM
jgi:hypothetical protein